MFAGLRRMGLNVFPLRPESKRPIAGVSWKDYQSRRYEDDIPETCNAGVICGDISGRLFVLDIDDDSLYEELRDDTFTVRTARGYHLYYRYRAFAPPTRRLDDKRGRHVDIQSEGTYVVAPGSRYVPTDAEIASGKYPESARGGVTYEVIRDLPIRDVPTGEIRKRLEDMGFDTQTSTVAEIENGVSEGGRNDAMFKYACYLMRHDQLYDAPLLAQMEAVNARNSPPLSGDELRHIVESATRYEGGAARRTHPEIRRESEEPLDVPMQRITADHEGVPVRFQALVTAVGERHTYTKSVNASCDLCGKTETLRADEFHQIGIPVCMRHKRQYALDRSTMVTEYIQLIRVEEFLETARNSTPVQFDAEIIGDKIGEAYIGDRKELVARFRSIPTKEYNKIVFDVQEMSDVEQKEGCMPTDEELERWRRTPDMFGRVRDSIAPEMHMDASIKETGMLAIAGGTSLNGKRDHIHVAFCGDGQLGKSELLAFLHRMVPGSGRAIGTSSSGAGLTIGMVKLYNGQMVPKAGMLPSHTGFPVIIDECDKMRKDDLNSLLQCMEQQIVSQAKAGTGSGLTLPARCGLLIAANPVNGKYNPRIGFMDNFVFEAPFISRFDIVWVLVDRNDPEHDRRVRRHIREYKRRKDEYMGIEELQRYFTYVRSLKPEVPEDLEGLVDALHEDIRPRNKIDGLPVGWRQYYGIHRLVTASAALHLRETVTAEDFELVKRIINESFESIPMNGHGLVKRRDSKETVILEAWHSVCNDDGLAHRDDFVAELSKSDGFGLNADHVFDTREAAGVFQLDNSTGMYRKVR